MSQPVRFGLSLPNRAVLFGLPIETLLASAVRAEESGRFDSVWVGDNLLSKARLEAVVTLSAIAARTRRVKLGTVCLASFTLRHPLLFAIQWASLDQLSGGRTLLAVCAGGAGSKGPQFAAELAAMGVASVERVRRMEEGIELLRRFWGPGPISHQGEFYQFSDVDVLPKPAQANAPILIAVNPPVDASAEVEERAMRRVAKLADGWQTDGVPPAIFRRRWEMVRGFAAEYGRSDVCTDASLHLMVNINDDADAALKESVAFLEQYYGRGMVSDAKLAAWLAYGPPEAVAARIQEFVDAGCTTPILRFTGSNQQEQLERCIAEVLPAFAQAGVSEVRT
jgi:alkanesulfonate monooxygenase SsuD/methylene tetrahydromethanopterin reductase-like flavin-dependent oxidoreductase (luciferase family)